MIPPPLAATSDYLSGIDPNCFVLRLLIPPGGAAAARIARDVFGRTKDADPEVIFVPAASAAAHAAAYEQAKSFATAMQQVVAIANSAGLPPEAVAEIPPRSQRPVVVFEDLAATMRMIGPDAIAMLASSGGLRMLVFLTPAVGVPDSVTAAFAAAVPAACTRRFDSEFVEAARPGAARAPAAAAPAAVPAAAAAAAALLPNVGHKIVRVPMSYTQMAMCTGVGCSRQSSAEAAQAHACTNAEPRVFGAVTAAGAAADDAAAAIPALSSDEARSVGAMYRVRKSAAAVWISAPAFGIGKMVSLLDIVMSGKIVALASTLAAQAQATRLGATLPPETIAHLSQIAEIVTASKAPASAAAAEDVPGAARCPGGVCPPGVLDAAARAGVSPTDGHVVAFRDGRTMAVAASVLAAMRVPTVVVSAAHKGAGRDRILLGDFNAQRDAILGRATQKSAAAARRAAAEAARERRARRAIAKQFRADAAAGRFAAAGAACPVGSTEAARDMSIKVFSVDADDDDAQARQRRAARQPLSPFATEAALAALAGPAGAGAGAESSDDDDDDSARATAAAAACPVALLTDVALSERTNHVSHVHLFDAADDPLQTTLTAYGSGAGAPPARMLVHHYVGVAGAGAGLRGDDPPDAVSGAAAAAAAADDDPDVAVCAACDGRDDGSGDVPSDGDTYADVALPWKRYVGRATVAVSCTDERQVEETVVKTTTAADGTQHRSTETRSYRDPGSSKTLQTVTREYNIYGCGELRNAAARGEMKTKLAAAFRAALAQKPRAVTAADDACPALDGEVCHRLRQIDSERAAAVADSFRTAFESGSRAALDVEALQEDQARALVFASAIRAGRVPRPQMTSSLSS